MKDIQQEIKENIIIQDVKCRQRIIRAANGAEKADLVLKNANYVNVFSNELCSGDIAIAEGVIVGIGENYEGIVNIDVSGKIVCPGFIDSHIHLESAAVMPEEFAKAVIPHGTTTVIADPHEIANVLGTDGIEYMIQASAGLPLDINFMLPSCVPATPFDESGANLNYNDIEPFYKNPRVLGLAEMMNYIGVINAEADVIAKIVNTQAHNKMIDGHAPGLSGKSLDAYISAGIYSDHECSTYEEALEKIRLGQFIMIREGTAAKNLETLLPLLNNQYYSRCMFATDDKHPNDLLNLGHIDYIIKEAIKRGADPIIAVKVGTLNAAEYFKLSNKGAIAPGYLADLAVIDNFESFSVETVIKNGTVVYKENKVCNIKHPSINEKLNARAHGTFNMRTVCPKDFTNDGKCGVIGLVKDRITTENCGYAESISAENDILKIAVIERHKNTGHIGIGFLSGYGLKSGAVATSISHDSHNLIVVGCNEADMAIAANRVAENAGGVVVVNNGGVTAELELPIAGLMSEEKLSSVNNKLEKAKEMAFGQGASRMVDPFMTLSFISLPVIPTLRLTTRGVFDAQTQKYI